MIRPHGYPYLKYEDSRDKSDCLLESEFSRKIDSIIIWDSDKRLYYLYDSYKHLDFIYPEDKYSNIHEVILEWQHRKFYADIDGHADDVQLLRIIDQIEFWFESNGFPNPKLEVFESNGASKNSAHIICTNYQIHDINVSKLITKQIYMLLDDEDKAVYDDSINKKTQRFRMPGSTKDGRTLVINTPGTRKYGMLTIMLYGPVIRNIGETQPIESNYQASDVKRIMEQAAPFIVGFKYRNMRGNYINLDRIKSVAPIKCDVCSGEHTNDNTKYLHLTPTGVYLGCRRAPQREHMIICHPVTSQVADFEFL